jgi:carbon-monoxide dehydrogenase medium subunit
VAITGVSDRAFMAESAARLVDTRAEPEAIDAVAKGALDGAEISSDLHAPANYRAHLTRVAVRRALTTALGRSA